MTSHYFEQYKSEGYAATSRDQISGLDEQETISSRAASPDSSHPLFEPDLVNSFAEPLCVPFAIRDCIQNLEVIVKDKTTDFPKEELKALSKSTFENFEGRLDCMPSGECGVRDFVLRTKFEIFADSIKKIASFYNVPIDEKWDSSSK